MKKIIFYLFLIIFSFCTHKKQNKNYNIQINNHLEEIDSVNGYNYIYYFEETNDLYNKDRGVLYKLDSVVLHKKNKWYTLNLISKNIYSKNIEGNIYANQDFNFDGINDIMLYPHVENYSVYGYDYRATYFLYDKDNNKFEEEKQLDSIYNLEVCGKNKYLISKSRYGLVKYKWDKDSLKPIELIKEIDLENGQFSVKETNLIEKTNKEYISKNSVIANFQCE